MRRLCAPRTLASARLFSSYASPSSLPRVTFASLDAQRASRTPFSVVTAYDAPGAAVASAAGVDVLLVGDSVGMVSLGYPSTVPVTLDAMVHHCSAVSRGASPRPLLLGDLPFGTYATPDDAVRAGVRLVQAGGVHGVKLEGGASQVPKVRALVGEGVPVVGHVGLLPQTAGLGGAFSLRARSAAGALRVVEDALALEDAGVRAIVLEMLPAPVARAVTAALRVPTIGIGAGPHCSGQVLVLHDLLGVTPRTPSFVKRYAEVGREAERALAKYVAEVRAGDFPGEGFFKGMAAEEVVEMEAALSSARGSRAPAAVVVGAVRAQRAAPGGEARALRQQAPPPRPPLPPLLPAPPRVAVIGSGAIATLLAASFSAAGAEPTLFTSWASRAAQLRAEGARVWGDAPAARQLLLPAARLPVVDAAGALSEWEGSFDVVFLAGKAPSVDAAGALAWRLVAPPADPGGGDGGAVVPLYNGAFTFEYLRALPLLLRRGSGGGGIDARCSAGQVGFAFSTAGAAMGAVGGCAPEVALTGAGEVFAFLPREGACSRGAAALRSLAARGPPLLPLLLPPAREWASARAAKLAVNAVLNPLAALTGLLNGELAAALGGGGGCVAATGRALAGEAFSALAPLLLGGAPGGGARALRDGGDVLEAATAAAAATARNTNSMLADARGARLSEVDFVCGAVAAALAARGEPRTATERVAAALVAKERALGVRGPAEEARLCAIFAAAAGAPPLED